MKRDSASAWPISRLKYLWSWRAPDTTERWASQRSHWSWAEICPRPVLSHCLLCCSLGWQEEAGLMAEEVLPASEDTGHQSGCLVGQCLLLHSCHPVWKHRHKDITGQTGGQWYTYSVGAVWWWIYSPKATGTTNIDACRCRNSLTGDLSNTLKGQGQFLVSSVLHDEKLFTCCDMCDSHSTMNTTVAQ